MSEKGVITKRDLAEFVLMCQEGDVSAHNIASMNVAHAFWAELGSVETDPDVTEDKAEEILAELPTEWEEWN